jgi:hypothetical protein
MTRAIVDQKLHALLSAEARLHRALERSLECGAFADAYRKAEDEYNEAFVAWWHSPRRGVGPAGAVRSAPWLSGRRRGCPVGAGAVRSAGRKRSFGCVGLEQSVKATLVP